MPDTNKLDFSLVLASSVHDMKNSLGMLLNSLEDAIHATPVQDEDQRRRFGILQYEASRINTELIQLLTLYRIQEERLPLRIDGHYVIDVLDEQLARNYMLFEMRDVEVEFDCDPDLHWYFDNDLVGGVIHNVLVNCVRYTKSALLLHASVVDERLCIQIADDGQGYPPMMLNTNCSTVNSQEDTQGKTHLGLFFAQQIAAKHCQQNICGSIELENGGPLGGGNFKLYIP